MPPGPDHGKTGQRNRRLPQIHVRRPPETGAAPQEPIWRGDRGPAAGRDALPAAGGQRGRVAGHPRAGAAAAATAVGRKEQGRHQRSKSDAVRPHRRRERQPAGS